MNTRTIALTLLKAGAVEALGEDQLAGAHGSGRRSGESELGKNGDDGQELHFD